MRLKRYCRLGLVVVPTLALLWLLLKNLLPLTISLRDPATLDVLKCPACYGEHLCPDFLKKDIVLTDWTQYKILSRVANAKNVFRGVWGDEKKKVVLKKLAHDHELDELDEKLCSEENSVAQCMRSLTSKLTRFTNQDPKTTFPYDLLKSHISSINKHLGKQLYFDSRENSFVIFTWSFRR